MKMNSMSVCPESVMEQIKGHKSFDFVKLYNNAAEIKGTELDKNTTKIAKKTNRKSQAELMIKYTQSPNKTSKKENSANDLSHTEDDEHNSSTTTRSSRKSNVKAAPTGKGESLDDGVKSIMKNKSNHIDSLLNVSNVNSPRTKPKKRNKSVSFMREDSEEMVVKKSKSNNSGKVHKEKEVIQKNYGKEANIKTHKQKKRHQSKENQNLNEDTAFGNKENVTSQTNKVRDSTSDPASSVEVPCEVKKKVKKDKKPKPENENDNDVTVAGEVSSQNKSKKSRKKKRKVKSMQDGNTDSTEGEPTSKARKKDLKHEVIAEGLENLNIGDNAHTLTNLLDEMTVVEKNAKKKERQKQRRNKVKKQMTAEGNQVGASQEGVNVEEKEKVKWSNRKWNKDVKGDLKSRLNTSIVVENLPIKIMCNYKKLLSEHFSKFGTIAGIGVAEAYPTEDLKPVFTTTIFFLEEEAVAKALEEDNTVVEGSRVRVRRARSPAETTLVARAYGLTEQALSSLFSAAGRVRTIRLLVKGKKAIPTAFIEFDGPEAVERALKLAEDAKINGKKMYVSRYEIRDKGKPHPTEQSSMNGHDNDSSAE